jgi:hypothetical protein
MGFNQNRNVGYKIEDYVWLKPGNLKPLFFLPLKREAIDWMLSIDISTFSSLTAVPIYVNGSF